MTPYAEGHLVLVVNRQAEVDVGGLDGLTRPEVKHIAIANPISPRTDSRRSRPWRRRTRRGSRRSWSSRNPSARPSSTSRRATRRSAWSPGRSRTCRKSGRSSWTARSMTPSCNTWASSPARGNPEAARKLADFLPSDKGQEILASFGFDPIRRGPGVTAGREFIALRPGPGGTMSSIPLIERCPGRPALGKSGLASTWWSSTDVATPGSVRSGTRSEARRSPASGTRSVRSATASGGERRSWPATRGRPAAAMALDDGTCPTGLAGFHRCFRPIDGDEGTLGYGAAGVATAGG